MTSRRTTVMLTLAGSMILLLAGGDVWAEDQVERPFFIQGNTTLVADLTTVAVDPNGRPYVEWEGAGSAVATHGGQCTLWGEGIMYLDEGVFPSAIGSGLTITANADEVSWDLEETGPNHMVVTFTSGTGRFENVGGGFSFDYEAEMELVGNLLIITYSYTGSGTIKY